MSFLFKKIMKKLGFRAHIVPLISYVTLQSQTFVNFGTACFICDPPGHEVPFRLPGWWPRVPAPECLVRSERRPAAL